MNIWELPKEHYNWESPITKIYGDIHNEIVRQDEEHCMYTIEQAIGYKVDKEELIKALQYDRNQYDKGYNDGVRETFVEELEKIKEECEDLIQFHGKRTDDYGIGKKEAYKHIIEFVNERIAKLKGENK